MRLRRPSLPTALAFVALFVALDGPVRAERFVEGKLRKGSVASREVDNRSLRTRDLKRKTVRALRKTRNSSITEAKLRNGSVTPGKLAAGAVGAAAIADNAITATDLAPASVGGVQIADRSVTGADIADGSLAGADIADGSLGAHDLGRFWGRFTIAIPAIVAGDCWSGAPADLAPERAGADISQDLVLATPNSAWPEDLAFTVHNDGRADRFVITACASGTATVAFDAGIRYLVIDLP